jgi:hypothetical protein
MATLVFAADKPKLTPFTMPDRFRHDITYFRTPAGDFGVPELPGGEYWVRLEDARRYYEDGAIHVVSPLDSNNRTEIEITEEQENWLKWMIVNEIEHVRLL